MVNLFILKYIDLFGLFDSFRSQHLQSNYFAWLSNYISPSKQQVKNGPIRRNPNISTIILNEVINYWFALYMQCHRCMFSDLSPIQVNLKCFRDFGHTYNYDLFLITCTCTIYMYHQLLFCFVSLICTCSTVMLSSIVKLSERLKVKWEVSTFFCEANLIV